MALHGSLLTMPLADVLTWVKTTSRSGLLSVTRDGSDWELLLESGAVVAYAGPELRDNLGHIVVTSGLLTEEDLRAAYQYQRAQGGSLQRALLGGGLISEAQLQECLKELACESIYDLFLDLPGEFVFSEERAGALDLGLEDEPDRLPMHLDINHLLMEGVRRQDEWQHIRERFPDEHVAVEVRHDKLPPLEKLGVRERRILASLDAGQSVSDICFELRAPIPSVLRALANLEEGGGVHLTRKAGESTLVKDQRVDQLKKQSAVLRQAGQLEEAIALLEVAVRMHPHDEGARQDLRDLLGEQIRDLYAMVPPVKVPYLVADEARVARLRLRGEERFLLDRLSAQMDVGSLVMVSSMSERETLKALHKLLHAGIIGLR